MQTTCLTCTTSQCVKCSVLEASDALIKMQPGKVNTAFVFVRNRIENKRGTLMIIPSRHAVPQSRKAVHKFWFTYGGRKYTATRRSNDNTAYIVIA